MTDGMGNAEMVRTVAEQVAEAVLLKIQREGAKEATIPAPLKWAAGIAAATFSALVTAGLIWMVVTLAAMSTQVGIITEQLRQDGAIDLRFSEQNRRLDKLEREVTER